MEEGPCRPKTAAGYSKEGEKNWLEMGWRTATGYYRRRDEEGPSSKLEVGLEEGGASPAGAEHRPIDRRRSAPAGPVSLQLQ